MAMRFCDSFDHYTTGFLTTKWDAVSSGADNSITTGRFSQGWQTSFSKTLRKTIDAQPTWIIGFAAILQNGANTGILSALYDGGVGGTTQVELRLDSQRRLQATRAGTVLGTGTTVIPLNTWVYIEYKVTINNSTGVFVVRLNGATEINLSSQDTQNTANATADTFELRPPDTFAVTFDDFYACDGTGAVNNDFLGDVRVESRLPNGNGNSSVFVGSDGNSTDNYLLVDESTPNGDTDYVQGTSVGDKDTYAFQDATPTSGAVHAVQAIPYARKTDAGSRSICSVARLSGTESDGANHTLSVSYQYHRHIFETKPGGGAWSISDFNSSEFGAKVTV